MIKKLFFITIAIVFILSSVSLCAFADNKTPAVNQIEEPTAPTPPDTVKDRASRGMNNLFYGPVEIPENLSQTNTKGAPVKDCTQKTRSGVERGIARVFTGIWQLATFWNADSGCVTKAPTAQAVTGKSSTAQVK